METYIIKKIDKEKEIIKLMISMYCNKHCKNKRRVPYMDDKTVLCTECMELLDYSNERISKCPFIKTKTFCSNCKIHCYQQNKREEIKKVMRYSGPKLILHHPIMLISHIIKSKREKESGQ